VQVWLIVAMALLGTLRTMQLGLERAGAEAGREIWCFTLLSERYGTCTKVWLYILYPIYVLWVGTGTCWVVPVLTDPVCVANSYELCYLLVWLLIFYLWLFIYAYAILQSMQYTDPYLLLQQQYESHHLPLTLQEPLLSGISYHALASLEVREIVLETDQCCAVCIEAIRAGECVRVLPCQHHFHLQCIDYWLLRNSACPLCKRRLRSGRRRLDLSP
jgi:hypothetical protein